MIYTIPDDRLYKLVDQFMTDIYGELVTQDTPHTIRIWGEGEYGFPTNEDEDFIPPFELNRYGILWNNLGPNSPHLTLEDVFNVDPDMLLAFYLERKFGFDIRKVETEEEI